jgi:hypothetical protein
MTVESVERKARRLIQDTESPYRWSSEEMRDALQEGVFALNAIRPETRYVNGELQDSITISDAGEFPINRKYEEALVYYVVYKCYLNDNTDTVNAQLAEMYLGKFNTKAQL